MPIHLLKITGFAALLLAALPTLGAASHEVAGRSDLRTAVVAHYADLLQAESSDAWRAGIQLQAAVENFLAEPTAPKLDLARAAWIQARKPYLQIEASRFYEGPIDTVDGYLNAWPIDENYIDYTASQPREGIINRPDLYPVIDRTLLLRANEREGEKNISTGFHALEFLLWGQDFDEAGPGRRLSTDYSRGGTNHPERRRQYLTVATALLVEHLRELAEAWEPGRKENYRARWLALDPNEALALLFKGLGLFSGAELAGERLLVPYTTKESEDEHSCFSDTTHLDFLYDQMGIQNICTGRYLREDGTVLEGPGVLRLLEGTGSAEVAASLRKDLETALAAIRSIPAPFDQAIRGRDAEADRLAIKRALDALQTQTASIARAAKALGLQLNL